MTFFYGLPHTVGFPQVYPRSLPTERCSFPIVQTFLLFVLTTVCGLHQPLQTGVDLCWWVVSGSVWSPVTAPLPSNQRGALPLSRAPLDSPAWKKSALQALLHCQSHIFTKQRRQMGFGSCRCTLRHTWVRPVAPALPQALHFTHASVPETLYHQPGSCWQS